MDHFCYLSFKFVFDMTAVLSVPFSLRRRFSASIVRPGNGRWTCQIEHCLLTFNLDLSTVDCV